MTRDECLEAAGDDELLFADGYDEAIIGVAQRFNDVFVCYDKAKVLSILEQRDGMSPDEALEFFDFNVVGAFVGEKTPAFVIGPSVVIDLADIEETRAYFDHEIPHPYREAFDLLLAEVKKRGVR